MSVARARPTTIEGETISVVEFSSKNVGNLGTALFGRALGPNTGINPATLADFDRFLAEW